MTDPLLSNVIALNGANSPGPGGTPFSGAKAAKWLSIHHYSDFSNRHPKTTTLGYYICRMGKGAYVLMKSPNNSVKDDFYSSHDYLFPKSIPAIRYYSEASERDLLAFSLMRATMDEEQSLAHLLLATGALHNALGLERPHSTIMPPTSKTGGKFDFKVKNHNGSDYTFAGEGQIEVDLIVSGIQDKRVKLYVIEAKKKGKKDIANWKFLFPAASVKSGLRGVNKGLVDVIPTYLHTYIEDGFIHFDLATFSPVAGQPIDIVKPSFNSRRGIVKDPAK
jgi:hypothetical protein